MLKFEDFKTIDQQTTKMKKLLLILLCFPIIFSCGEKDNKINKLEDRIEELEGKFKIITKGKENDYNTEYKKLNKKADDLKKQKEFYISKIKSDSTKLFKLKNDSEEQEKFAREKFLMKKDNEDIFIIRKNED